MATRNLNKVMLIGNLTRDPEVRYTPQGNAVASFVVATNREWKSDGETKQVADFHNVVAWNKLAEICGQLLKKGTKVYVEGRLQTRNWEDSQGSKKYKTEVVVDDMIILTPKRGADETEGVVNEEPQVEEQQQQPGYEDINLDDLGDLDLGDTESKTSEETSEEAPKE
jgi:single-strand DNA-binding protein